MKKGTSRKLTEEQKAEAGALANLHDEMIDTSDVPEILDWSGAKRGLLYRPVKQQITLRLDADVVSWFKANAPNGRGYQTEINSVLREHARQTLNHTSLRETVIEALIRDEGFRCKPYQDSVGKLTIGFGRNLDDKGISGSEARMLLANDVDDAWKDLDNNCPWWTEMPEPARAALLNQCFNMGWPRLSTFKKMLAALEKGDYHDAAAEAEDSKWFRQVGERGKRVANLYRDSMSA
jgi:lysozyme